MRNNSASASNAPPALELAILAGDVFFVGRQHLSHKNLHLGLEGFLGPGVREVPVQT